MSWPRYVLVAIGLTAMLGGSVAFAGLTEYQAAVKSNPSLIGYYTFDDGTANDSAPLAPTPHNGTLTGTTAFTTGVGSAGQALSLTGSGHVSCGAVPEFAFPTGVGTVEAWIRPAGTGNGVFAACRNGTPTRYSLHTEGGVYTSIWTALIWSNSMGSFTANTWRHVVYVFNGSEYYTYIDGRYVPNRGGIFSLGTETTAPFQIGSSSAAGSERWNGLIDEVAIYSGMLTADEVMDHFAKISTSPPITASPLRKTFFTPADMGPQDVTLSLVGAVGAAGGTPLTLTYTATVISITTEDGTPIASGGTVTVPEGAGSVIVKVSPATPVPAAGGTSNLVVSGTGLLSVTAGFNVKVPPSSAMLDYQAAVRATPSLISYYTFDDDTGLTIQDVAHPTDPLAVKHDGKLGGQTTELSIAPTLGTHPGGSALQLDAHGMALFGPVSDFEFPDGTGTLEAWLRPISNVNYQRVWAGARDGTPTRYSAHMNANANLVGSWNGTNYLTASYVIDPNIWYHVAFAYDVTKIHVYINGAYVADIAHGPGMSTGVPFMLGAPSSWSNYGNTTNNERFYGQIDEVALYSDVLPPETIQDHFLKLQPVVTMTPSQRFWTTPADVAPLDVTLGLSGPVDTSVATPITLTYDEAVIAVTTTDGTPIASGGTASVPVGATTVGIKVTPLAVGATNLTAAATSGGITLLPATGQFAMRAPVSAQLAAYQGTVMSEPSLISYYTFDTEPDGTLIQDRAPALPTPIHDGTMLGVGTLAPRTDVAGGALELTGTGHVNFGAISDFTFADGTGTVEAWVRPGWALDAGPGDLVIAASRDVDARYSIHVGANRRYINSFTGYDSSWGWVVPPLFEDRWYHVVFVYDNPQVFRCYVDGVLYASQCSTGYPVGAGGHHALGTAIDPTFQIGSSSSSGRERFIGGLDEVAIYEDPLTDAQVAAHYQTIGLTLTPRKHVFVLPAEAGPMTTTLSRPLGSAGPFAVTLTFDASVVAVDAGAGPIASGSAVVIPSGQPGLDLAVTALNQGATTLTASAAGFISANTVFSVRTLANGEIMIVDDNFDDNPTDIAADRLTSLLINLNGPGDGFYYLTGKTHQESGTEWQVLESGGDYSRAMIAGKEADEFDIMTPKGVGIEWKITNAQVSVDNTVSHAQFVGGELADCYDQLGMVSAKRLNNGDNELYAVDTAGGLFVAVFYERNTSNTDLIVTGNVRAVNKTKVGSGDTEDVDGLETLATFTLPGVTSITPDNPLYVTMKANQYGWSVGFPASTGVVFSPMPAVSGVHVAADGRLAGGWDATSLNDAEITDEFSEGAFATAQCQNMGPGRGSSSIDRIRVCVGCQLFGDCPVMFADADQDGDVDQDDFGIFQACYTGNTGTVLPGCGCFDRDGSGDIGAADLAAFLNCALLSGPTIPADPSCLD